MKQLDYKVPIGRIRNGFGRKVKVMDVVKRRENVWRPVKLTGGLFLLQLVGFGLFLWVGGSVNG